MKHAHYRLAVTLWKAFWTWMQTLGVTAAAGLVAVPWPEDGPDLTAEQWTQFIVLTLVPACWRALENWRKNSGPGGLPRWEWREIFGRVSCLLAGIALAGCAFAGTQARIIQTDPQGFTEDVEFQTRGVVTWGSSQELQRGDLDYTWGEGEHFRAGGSATRQESEDPVTDVLVRLVDKLLERPARAGAVEGNGTEEGSGDGA